MSCADWRTRDTRQGENFTPGWRKLLQRPKALTVGCCGKADDPRVSQPGGWARGFQGMTGCYTRLALALIQCGACETARDISEEMRGGTPEGIPSPCKPLSRSDRCVTSHP
jgi:hypothetical protein